MNNRRTRQMLSRLCVLPLYLIGFAAYAASLSFVDNGHPVKTIEISALVRNSELKTLTINIPTDSIIRSYQGVSLIPLLDAVFDSQWKTRDAIKGTSINCNLIHLIAILLIFFDCISKLGCISVI